MKDIKTEMQLHHINMNTQLLSSDINMKINTSGKGRGHLKLEAEFSAEKRSKFK